MLFFTMSDREVKSRLSNFGGTVKLVRIICHEIFVGIICIQQWILQGFVSIDLSFYCWAMNMWVSMFG